MYKNGGKTEKPAPTGKPGQGDKGNTPPAGGKG
jgi:hypothetical protein